MVTSRLLIRIMSEIKSIMEEKELSSRELSYMCEKKGHPEVTRSKILRAFYVGEGKQNFLNSTDDTIEGVLDALGYTGEDILMRILKKDCDPKEVPEEPQSNFPEEIIDFISKDEALPYLELSYAQYNKVRAEQEYERKMKEILKSHGGN